MSSTVSPSSFDEIEAKLRAQMPYYDISSRTKSPVRSTTTGSSFDQVGSSYYQPQQRGVIASKTQPSAASVSAVAKPKGYFEQLAGFGLGIGNLLAENILSHPCIIFRRQCQVNSAKFCKYHIAPFTLLPVVYNLQAYQGFGCFWKGVTSNIILQGLSVGVEKVLGDFTGLQREVNRYSSSNKVAGHLLLKAISAAITTPFAVSCFVETVRSRNDRPNIFDFLKEGCMRLSDDLTGPRDNRRIAIWFIMAPATVYRLSHYIISSITYTIIHAAVRRRIINKSNNQRSIFDDFYPGLCAAFTSHLMADGLLFPIETVLHRIMLQGSRAIVDNMDNGIDVMSSGTRYDGFLDCICCMYRDEGISGFYKGFGALVLQYGLHLLILRLLKLLFEQLEGSMREERTPPPASYQQSTSGRSMLTD